MLLLSHTCLDSSKQIKQKGKERAVRWQKVDRSELKLQHGILHLERTSKGVVGMQRYSKLEPVEPMAQCEHPRTQGGCEHLDTQVPSADVGQDLHGAIGLPLLLEGEPWEVAAGTAGLHSETVLNQYTSVSQLLGRLRIKSQDKYRQHSTALSEMAAGKVPTET